MGCQLRGYISDTSSLECNLSDASYWIMEITDEFNPKTNEYYEFEDPYAVTTPTYQTGIASAAILAADKIAANNYTELDVSWQKRMSEAKFNYARNFLTECAKFNCCVGVSY
jgi:hypothetical protein